ncbi:hypothetical protein BJY04DRAFT_217426 [Aspergillus karnatakaensis]|uniref:uncharacterized protein n=1 Tax=Aspergillus karnatakaensis TaxID=1810916 RepID=UPI003CCDABC2
MSLPTNLVWLASILGQSLSTSINRPAPLTNELVAVAHAELSIDLENSETYENPSTGLRINRVTRCIMSFCSRELNVTITNGILAEKILNRDWGEIFTHEYEANGRTTQIPCWKPSDSKFVHLKRTPGDPEYTQFPDESQFSFCPDLNPYLGLENVFFASMYENWQRVDDRSPPWSFLGSDINPPRILKDGLEHITTRVAASLTKYALNRSDHTVIGTMGLPEVYVAVEWRWLIFPAFLLVSTITLLVSTIWVNNAAGLPLWKFSVLPLLYHGLAAYHIPRIPPNGLGAVSALDSLAHETEVRLDRYGTPERYVLR